MSERYDRDEFRTWLTGYEGHAQPFTDAECPIVTYARRELKESVRLSEAPFKAPWCQWFVLKVDGWCARNTCSWGDLNVKEALRMLDESEVFA